MKCILLLATQFQIWDGLITQVFVNGGLAEESNQFVKHIVSSGNFLLLKITGAILCGLLLWILYKYLPKTALTAASSLALFYIAVVSWNFFVLFTIN
jgi:hypothetical protein